MEVNIEELQKKKFMVATPMYDSKAYVGYIRGMMDLTQAAVLYGLDMEVFFMSNDSLVTRARNLCVKKFLLSEAEHLMFIDSDIGFSADHVMAMLAMQDKDNYRVLAGNYPKKSIDWNRIYNACKEGHVNSPDEMPFYGGRPVVNASKFDFDNLSEPVEVDEVGTGFLMIHRSIIEEIVDANPDILYNGDHNVPGVANTENIPAVFDAGIKDNRYLSEDYMFCDRVKSIGEKVWLMPIIQLLHFGSYTYVNEFHKEDK